MTTRKDISQVNIRKVFSIINILLVNILLVNLLWNELPLEIREIRCQTTFKFLVKRPSVNFMILNWKQVSQMG